MPIEIRVQPAQENPSLILELHHRRMDEMLERVEIAVELGSWGEARKLFARFRSELEEHIRIEEQVMFPSFDAFMRLTGGPTTMMRMEHAEIARCMDATEELLGAEQEGDAFDRMQELLAAHNVKEEQVLYPMFERHAPAQAYNALVRELRPLVRGT
jgi:iron-sulfur cluster repair protein YtfE (RIC family)